MPSAVGDTNLDDEHVLLPNENANIPHTNKEEDQSKLVDDSHSQSSTIVDEASFQSSNFEEISCDTDSNDSLVFAQDSSSKFVVNNEGNDIDSQVMTDTEQEPFYQRYTITQTFKKAGILKIKPNEDFTQLIKDVFGA